MGSKNKQAEKDRLINELPKVSLRKCQPLLRQILLQFCCTEFLAKQWLNYNVTKIKAYKMAIGRLSITFIASKRKLNWLMHDRSVIACYNVGLLDTGSDSMQGNSSLSLELCSLLKLRSLKDK